MDCGFHPSDYLTGFLDSCPVGEQQEGVLWSSCHGRLPARDPDCLHYLKIDSLLLLLHSLLPVTWEPGTDKLLLSHILWNQSLLPWDSGGPKFIMQAGCQASTCTRRHKPSTCSSREGSLCQVDLTVPRNIFFHCYFPFLPHQLQALKSHCFLPCATVLAPWRGTQLRHYLCTLAFFRTL